MICPGVKTDSQLPDLDLIPDSDTGRIWVFPLKLKDIWFNPPLFLQAIS
jgi:hypothetical protein